MRQKLNARFFTPIHAAWILIGACALALFIRYPGNTASYLGVPPADFGVYFRAWERVGAGLNPYVISDGSPFKYSPGVLAIFGLLPGRFVGQAWFVFGSLCVIALAASLGFGSRYRSWKQFGALLLGLALAWKGILETLDYGQLEILLFAAAVASAATLVRRPMLSGLIAGALPWFKLPWLAFAFPLLLVLRSSCASGGAQQNERKGRLLISGYLFSTFIWGAAIPSLAFGPERALELAQSWLAVLRAQPHSLYFSDINQSLWITMVRWTGGSPELVLGLGGLLAAWLLGKLTAQTLRRAPASDSVMAWIGPWLLFVQLVNPLSWRWGSVVLLAAPFATAASPTRRSASAAGFRGLLWALVAILWLAQLNPGVRVLGFTHWTELHGYGLVTGYWLALLLLCI